MPLDEEAVFTGERAALVMSLDDALQDLEKVDADKARILELKYFGGMTAEESADLLGLSVHQVNRQMRHAQAWLRRELDTRKLNSREVEQPLQERAFHFSSGLLRADVFCHSSANADSVKKISAQRCILVNRGPCPYHPRTPPCFTLCLEFSLFCWL